MAEPIGMASGLLALVAFAYQSSVALHSLVKSFNSHVERVVELLEELSALLDVLRALSDTVDRDHGSDLSGLKLPMLRCGKACTEFAAVLTKCTSHSNSNGTSFRDWVKIRYMGDDIDGFRRLLSSYKQIISVALLDVNLRRSSATSESIRNLSEQLAKTQANLEDRLITMTDKLDIFGQTAPLADSDIRDMNAIREERLSTEKSLQLCANLLDHISEIQPARPREVHDEHSGDGYPSVYMMSSGLHECRESLRRTARKLEAHHKDLIGKTMTRLRAHATTSEQLQELASVQEELEAINKSREMCSTIKNSGTGDLFQVMASTDGTLIDGTNEGHGRVVQGGGHYDKESFETLMRNLQSKSTELPVEDLEVSVSETGSSVVIGRKEDRTPSTSFTGPGIRLSASGSNLTTPEPRRFN